MCSTSSNLHYKRGSNCVPPPSLQNLHRRCRASRAWAGKCCCLVRLSVAPWTRTIRSSSDVTGVPYTTQKSLEVSDLVTMLATELVPLYQYIYLESWGDSAHFYQSLQMAKGLYTCCIRTPTRIGTNSSTRSFSNLDALLHPNRAFLDIGSFLNSDQCAVHTHTHTHIYIYKV